MVINSAYTDYIIQHNISISNKVAFDKTFVWTTFKIF